MVLGLQHSSGLRDTVEIREGFKRFLSGAAVDGDWWMLGVGGLPVDGFVKLNSSGPELGFEPELFDIRPKSFRSGLFDGENGLGFDRAVDHV